MFIVTGIALYIIIRNKPRTDERINSDIADIHKSDKRIKEYFDTAETNARNIKTRIKDAADDNTAALIVISKLERTNERFRKLLLEIQKGTDN